MFGGNHGVSENVWKEMLNEVDDNGDGQVIIFLRFLIIIDKASKLC